MCKIKPKNGEKMPGIMKNHFLDIPEYCCAAAPLQFPI